MKVVMIGAGYVGLVTGACFSEFGFDVTCVDVDETKIKALENGEIPIYEPGLDDLVANNCKAGRLSFSTSLADAVPEADLVFIAVGTPSRRGDGYADLRYVYAAAEQVARNLRGYTTVVTKSTVPVGTGKEVARIVAQYAPASAEWDVVSNPEFLREGAAIEDFMRPDRVVMGAESDRARAQMRQLYRPLSLREVPMVFTDIVTAELIKYAANAFLATKITFINEISDLCEKTGADVQHVAKGIGLDGRIGGKFLHPGPGYGGSCFPKDTLALAYSARQYGVPLRIVEAVIDINDRRKLAMADRVIDALGGSEAARGKNVAVLGLTFKPGTDDMRESPALAIVPALMGAGIEARVYDPQGMDNAKAEIGTGPYYATSAYDALEGADCLALVTEWNEFRALQLDRVKSLMTSPIMVDMRNIYVPAEMRAAGFVYYGIGRGYDGIDTPSDQVEAAE
jgi:UDPglucose 6-dehydrogenase